MFDGTHVRDNAVIDDGNLNASTRAAERFYFSDYAVQICVDKNQCDLMINERQ